MKKTFIIFFLLFSTIFYGQEFNTPNAYFNYIGVEKEAICKLIGNIILPLHTVK